MSYLKGSNNAFWIMKKHKHSYHLCRYHFVFTPKYRKTSMQGIVKSLLEDLIHYSVAHQGGRVLELAIQPDHVHLFCELAPSAKLDIFIGKLKSWCSYELLKSIDGLRETTKNSAFWARGYFVATCGVDSSVIEHYIKDQQ